MFVSMKWLGRHVDLAGISPQELARELVTAFVAATFSGEERHRRRLGKVLDMESQWARGALFSRLFAALGSHRWRQRGPRVPQGRPKCHPGAPQNH